MLTNYTRQEKNKRKEKHSLISKKDDIFAKLIHPLALTAGTGLVGVLGGGFLLLASIVFPPLLIPSMITISVSGIICSLGTIGYSATYIIARKRAMSLEKKFEKGFDIKIPDSKSFNKAKKIKPGINKSRENAEVKIHKSKGSLQPVERSLTERRNEKNNTSQKKPVVVLKANTNLTKSTSNINLLKNGTNDIIL